MLKILAIVIFLSSTFSLSDVKNKTNCFINLSVHDFNLKLNEEEVFLLDVRLLKDYRKERIENAVCANNRDILVYVTKKITDDTPILVYCSDGNRSRIAAKILCEELHFKNVFNLKYGIAQWKKYGYDLDKSHIKRNKN